MTVDQLIINYLLLSLVINMLGIVTDPFMHHQCSTVMRTMKLEIGLYKPTNWNYPHPDDLPGPEDSKQFDEKIRNGLRNLGLRMWDIQRSQNSAGYLTIRHRSGRKILLSGLADFILTDQSADEADFLFHTLVVIEIQSQPDDALSELQIQVYLLLIMNTRALQSVFGVLVYTDGRCRAYRASRGGLGNNCVYEQNGIFYVIHLPQQVIGGGLLNRNT